LDLSELLEDEDGSWDQIAVYQYAAAVFHSGPTMDSGHYVAHVRNKDGNYFLLDDHGRPRVQRSSIKAINKAQNLDLTLVAYVKKCKKGKSEKADPVAEERVLKWWREHDSPPAATSTRNSPWPVHQPADLERPISKPSSPIPGHPKPKPSKGDNKKQYPPASDSPQQDPLKQGPPGQGASKQEFTKSDYVKTDEWQYKNQLRKLGLKLDGKKHPLEWYIDKLVRHGANATTYNEYTVDELIKGETFRRKLDPKGIATRAAVTKVLKRDDKEKGFNGPSVRSINSVQNREEKPGNPGNKPGKKEEEKPRRPPEGKKPDTFRTRRHTEKSETNDKTRGHQGGDKARTTGKDVGKGNRPHSKESAEDPETKDPEEHHSWPRANDSDRFKISATLQVLGKSSEAGPELMTHTWILPATYEPNFDLNVVGRLTVTAPGGQKSQFPLTALSERHTFHVDSLASTKNKRPAPSSDPGNDGPSSPKKATGKTPPFARDNEQHPKPPQKPIRRLKIKHKAAWKKGDGQFMNSAAEETPNETAVSSPFRLGSPQSSPTSSPSKRRRQKSSTDNSGGSNSSPESRSSPSKPVSSKKRPSPRAKGEDKPRAHKADSAQSNQRTSRRKRRIL
jgi:hypothetical protein